MSHFRFIRILLLSALVGAPGITGPSVKVQAATRSAQPAVRVAFLETALSPAISAASFHPKGYDKARNIWVDKVAWKKELDYQAPDRTEASVRVAWSSRLDAFATRRGSRDSKGRRRALRSLNDLMTAEQIQEVIERASSRSEATDLLRYALGLDISGRTLDNYANRHALTFPWKSVARQLDPQEVQMAIQNSRNRAEATDYLRREFGLSISGAKLGAYAKRHGLTAAWQYRSRHIDPHEVELLIQKTRSRAEAGEILRRKFGGKFNLNELTQYLRRHGLTAQWQYKRNRGMISMEMLFFVLSACVIFISVRYSSNLLKAVSLVVLSMPRWRSIGRQAYRATKARSWQLSA